MGIVACPSCGGCSGYLPCSSFIAGLVGLVGGCEAVALVFRSLTLGCDSQRPPEQTTRGGLVPRPVLSTIPPQGGVSWCLSCSTCILESLGLVWMPCLHWICKLGAVIGHSVWHLPAPACASEQLARAELASTARVTALLTCGGVSLNVCCQLHLGW
jgi:hypothetical protein